MKDFNHENFKLFIHSKYFLKTDFYQDHYQSEIVIIPKICRPGHTTLVVFVQGFALKLIKI